MRLESRKRGRVLVEAWKRPDCSVVPNNGGGKPQTRGPRARSSCPSVLSFPRWVKAGMGAARQAPSRSFLDQRVGNHPALDQRLVPRRIAAGEARGERLDEQLQLERATLRARIHRRQ